ncbi:tyrosine-type recombinase/integrase [Paraburkholderia youngii]|uniref:tyrosine-type recombinase/integrase n=1 Tax=Paraburkholderia youngii TaxID=2782701 RepID=UPI0020CDE6A5|nr:site-specific integrase [Paraburkholderia youngii]
MFDRFLRHINEKSASVATFDAAHIESFFNEMDKRTAPGTSTRLRYIKMLHRLCRHLVEIGLRTGNPAAELSAFDRWPEDEPQPVFLDPAADQRLQAWTEPSALDDPRMQRNRAIVALFMGTGISTGELRQAQQRHLIIDDVRPNVYIPKRGPRHERRVTIPAFAVAALQRWTDSHRSGGDALLFPAPGGDNTINDVLLGAIVNAAVEQIGIAARDMSPRILRNTFARRQLLAGRSNEDTSQILGLISHRTVTRLRATISGPGGA